jgi:RHS repeat-associated protein
LKIANATYLYDPVDDLRSVSVGTRASTLTYNAATKRLDSVVTNGLSTAHLYDGNGNISTKGSQFYTFDLGNRMASASLGGSYSYDGHGRRTKIVNSDGTNSNAAVQPGGPAAVEREGRRWHFPGHGNLQLQHGHLIGHKLRDHQHVHRHHGIELRARRQPKRQHVHARSQPATPIYKCGTVVITGTQCPVAANYTATSTYSCPSGGSRIGTTCTQTTTYSATSSSTCPSGGTLSGGTCLKTTNYGAAVAYSCPSGGSLNGSTCSQTNTYAATSAYSCTAGDTLNGSTCTHITAAAAAASYSCPNGGTLSGTQCTGPNTTSTAYIYLGGKQIAETVVGGLTQYVHTDALGSPVAHTNQAAAELNRTRFEPYGYTAGGAKPGVTTTGLSTTGSAIGFTGHVNDPQTDLVYMQQRYYDPIAGRFLSVDSVKTNMNTGGALAATITQTTIRTSTMIRMAGRRI